MTALRNALNRILHVLAGVSFLVMVVLTCWQVFTRYILGSPSTWSEELVSYMNIPIVVDRMNPILKKAFGVLGEGIAFLFSAVILVYGGVQISSLAMGQMTSSLGVAVGLFYVVLPLCGVLNMIYTALNILDICREKKEA